MVRDAEIGRRQADKLVKVWRGDGSEIWVLIHVEIQSQAQPNFAARMYVYNYRIFDLYQRSVVSLAVLADDRPKWRPNCYASELWGCHIDFQFPMVKLLDYQRNPTLLQESTNPFAILVAAHLTTQQTRQDPHSRYQGKLSLVKSLYRRGLSRQGIVELFRLIDWMMVLPEGAEIQFQQALREFEDENQMPYVTSIERLAREEGLSQGVSQGIVQQRQEDVVEVLAVRFTEVPDALRDEIAAIEDLEQLKQLHRQAITISSLEAFQDLLESLD